jgi:serine/threonine-protein kinase
MSSSVVEPNAKKPEPKTAPSSGKSNAIKALGGFELISKIGQGGMGSVFKARQVSLDRIVAVKVLPPSVAKMNPLFVDRFIREARTSARLNHPNIVQGIDVDKDESTGLYYFAMEFIDGPTAKMLIKEQRVIPVQRAIEIIIGVTEALICAHRAGIIHRDVKPDNILLTAKGEVKLADLGLARGYSAANEEETDERKRSSTSVDLSESGTRVGTPAYMAPEQIRGDAENCDVRTDLYALGATFFHLVTGRFAYVAKTSAAVMNMHLNSPVPNAREVNPEVDADVAAIISKLMQKDPAKRYQSAEDLADVLDDLVGKKGMRIATSNYRRVTTSRVAPVTERDSVRAREKEKEREKPKAKPLNPLIIGGMALAGIGVVAGVILLLSKPAANNQAAAPKTEQSQPAAAPKEVKPAPAPAVVKESAAAAKPAVAPTPAVEKTPAPSIVTGAQKEKETVEPAAVKEAEKKPEPAVAEKEPVVAKAPETVAVTNDKPAPEKPVENAPPAPEKVVAIEPEKQGPTLLEQAFERMKGQLEKFDMWGAYGTLKQFENQNKLSDADKAALEAAFSTEVEARAKALVGEAQQLTADKAVEMLDAARLRDGKDLAKGESEARRMVAAARDAITTKKALSQMNAEIRQIGKVDNVMQAIAQSLQDNVPPEQVSRMLDQAITRPDMAEVAEALKTEKKSLTWVNDVKTSVVAGAHELLDGRSFSFTQSSDQKETRIGKSEHLQLVNVDDANLYIQPKHGTPHNVRIDSLSYNSRLTLSLLSCKGDKAAEAKLKLKWAYTELTSVKLGMQRISGILDEADRLMQDAAHDKAPQEMSDALHPWMLRGQNLVRASRKNFPAHSPVIPYIPFVSVWAGPGNMHCKITINGKVFVQGGEECRGINVLAVDGEQQVLKESYDGTDADSVRRFCDAITKLPKTALVVVTVWDDKGLTNLPAQVFGSLGATQAVQNLPTKDAYYCIGMPGLGGGLGVDELGPAPLQFPRPGR